NCATFTPTPTATPVNCCQCEGAGQSCLLAPANGACPDSCGFVAKAVCLASGNCATFTPTPTATPVNCCQCDGASPSCLLAPANGVCPDNCGFLPLAVRFASGNCANFTPTPTATPVNCCQCNGVAPSCSLAPANDVCPDNCEFVPLAVCLAPPPTGVPGS